MHSVNGYSFVAFSKLKCMCFVKESIVRFGVGQDAAAFERKTYMLPY